MNKRGETMVAMFAVYLILAAAVGFGVYFIYYQYLSKESFDRIILVKDTKLILETVNFANNDIIIKKPVKFDFYIVDDKIGSGFEADKFSINELKSIRTYDKEDYIELRS